MTKELIEIFEGKKIPEIRIVDYTTPEGKAKLKAVIATQEKILKRREVDWQQFNSFVINL
jgi:hypothetical protein